MTIIISIMSVTCKENVIFTIKDNKDEGKIGKRENCGREKEMGKKCWE